MKQSKTIQGPTKLSKNGGLNRFRGQRDMNAQKDHKNQ